MALKRSHCELITFALRTCYGDVTARSGARNPANQGHPVRFRGQRRLDGGTSRDGPFRRAGSILPSASLQSMSALGCDEFRAQFVALVGKPGFVVDAKAAVREWQDIEVADVHRLALGLSQPSELSGLVCQARAFEPVLLRGGASVVSCPTVGQHRGDAGAAR